MTPPTLVTIIPCYGNPHATEKCLESLLKQKNISNKILVIENETTQNNAVLSSRYPETLFFRNEKNEGFTGAVNRGLKEASAFNPDFLFILNNDAVLEDGAIEKLLEGLKQNPNAGIAAPKIYADAGKKTIWAAGGELFPWKFMARNRGAGRSDGPEFDRAETLPFVSGCALLIRKKTLDDLGGLDEDFFTYAEDLDFCLRARSKGWELRYEPSSHVIHEGSLTSGGQYEPFQSFYRWRNRLLLASKHGTPIHRSLFYFFFFPLLAARDLFVYARRKKFASIPFLFRGLFAKEPLRSPKPSRLKCGYLLSNPILISIFKGIDCGGTFLSVFFPKRSVPADIHKILIAKIDHLGDVLMSLYSLPILKKAFPGAEIHFISGSWSKILLEKHPLISKIHVYDDFRLNRNGPLQARIKKSISDFIELRRGLKNIPFDLSFDLRAYYPNFVPLLPFFRSKFRSGYGTGGFGFFLDRRVEWREGLHETEHILRLLEPALGKIEREPLDLEYLTDHENAQNMLDKFKIGNRQPFAVLHPFCQKSFLRGMKQWKTGEWRKIIAHLESKGIKVLCSGDAFDRPMIEALISGTGAVNIGGEISIQTLSGLIKKSQFTVTLDTFFAHLSGALGAKTYELFNDAEPVHQWKAWGVGVKTFPIQSEAEDLIKEFPIS